MKLRVKDVDEDGSVQPIDTFHVKVSPEAYAVGITHTYTYIHERSVGVAPTK